MLPPRKIGTLRHLMFPDQTKADEERMEGESVCALIEKSTPRYIMWGSEMSASVLVPPVNGEAKRYLGDGLLKKKGLFRFCFLTYRTEWCNEVMPHGTRAHLSYVPQALVRTNDGYYSVPLIRACMLSVNTSTRAYFCLSHVVPASRNATRGSYRQQKMCVHGIREVFKIPGIRCIVLVAGGGKH